MGVRDLLREFSRGMRAGLTNDSAPKLTGPPERALAAAEEITAEAHKLPFGSPTRARLNQIAEELRAYAAGEQAKAALGDLLNDPAIVQALKSAGIRLD